MEVVIPSGYEIDTEHLCPGCPKFSAVSVATLMWGDDKLQVCTHLITCAYKEQCDYIRRAEREKLQNK